HFTERRNHKRFESRLNNHVQENNVFTGKMRLDLQEFAQLLSSKLFPVTNSKPLLVLTTRKKMTLSNKFKVI
ncbi:hypothetical protein L0244_39575, partial [bacterium]|nr:hypothetical protein [bacterium]